MLGYKTLTEEKKKFVNKGDTNQYNFTFCQCQYKKWKVLYNRLNDIIYFRNIFL